MDERSVAILAVAFALLLPIAITVGVARLSGWSTLAERYPGETDRRWYGTTYRLVTRRAPEVSFALRAGTFDAIRADARAAGVAGDY